MNQIEVEIMGRGYILVCPEDAEARLRDAVRRVDDAMCKIRDAGKVRARDRIAVLAAVNLAFESGPQAKAVTPEPKERKPEEPPAAESEQKDLEFLLQRLDKTLEEK
jgi:cell division protein ZapA